MSRLRARSFLVVALGASLLASLADAQAPYPVVDLGATVRADTSIYYGPVSEQAVAGGIFYFRVDDGIHGWELWRSDGTPLGTFLLRDLCPGSCGDRGQFLETMAPLGDRLIFAADDGVHGVEPWITDGTALGTTRIADLTPGYGSTSLSAMVATSDQVFFVERRWPFETHLWRTDGTAKGTYTIEPPSGPGNFAPSSIHPGPGFLYLCNASWNGDRGLWRTDGTSSGTTFVAAVECWQNSFGRMPPMVVAPSGIFFFRGNPVGSAETELWRSDGTPAGTWKVKDIAAGPDGSSPWAFAWRDDELVFRASGGSELWRSDGTESGTTEISLADGATNWATSSAAVVVGDRFFFQACDLTFGCEPWVYDGVEATRIADLAPLGASSLDFELESNFFGYFESAGNDVLFVADDGVTGREVWRSDGTAAGTFRISDVSPGDEPFAMPAFWAVYDNSLDDRPLLLEQQSGSGERLWRLDSSGSSMEVLKTIDFQSSFFSPVGTDRTSMIERVRGRDCFEGVGSHLFFSRWGSEVFDLGARGLFRADGSLGEAVSILTTDSIPHAGCTTSENGLLVVVATDFSNSGDLVAIAESTGVATPLGASGFESALPGFLPLEGAAATLLDGALVVTSGTPETTTTTASGFDPYEGRLAEFDDRIAVAGSGLWITDEEEPTGARLLLAWEAETRSVLPEIVTLPDRFVFAAWDFDHGNEIWSSDGTVDGTALILDANPGPASTVPDISYDRYFESTKPRLVGGGSFVVFAGLSTGAGEELWVTDGTAVGTHLLFDLYPGPYPSTPRNFIRFGDRVFFTAETELSGLELFATDGTVAGTVLVKDIAPGAASSVPDDLVVRDGVLYFSAWNPTYGREAWKSDGTTVGTVRISDIAPGPKSSSPQRFTRAGNRLFFTANDNVHGYELWAISDDGSIPLFLDGFENESTSRWSESES